MGYDTGMDYGLCKYQLFRSWGSFTAQLRRQHGAWVLRAVLLHLPDGGPDLAKSMSGTFKLTAFPPILDTDSLSHTVFE